MLFHIAQKLYITFYAGHYLDYAQLPLRVAKCIQGGDKVSTLAFWQTVIQSSNPQVDHVSIIHTWWERLSKFRELVQSSEFPFFRSP